MCEPIRPKELISLRALGRGRSVAEEELPASMETAYDVAAATLGLLGTQAAGWKLGATTAATRRAFATEEIYYGALLAEEMWDSTQAAPPPAPPVLRGEAEIAFRMAVDIPREDSETALRNSAIELFDAWAPAIEAPYSCINNIADVGLRALLMDRCAAGALYLAQPRGNINDPALDGELEIFANSVCVARGAANTSLLITPIEAARGFLRVAAAQGVSVRRGQWISTGGITPCVSLPFDQPIQLTLERTPVLSLIVQAQIS
jgi:2-keto-4-pentenoate hydratase